MGVIIGEGKMPGKTGFHGRAPSSCLFMIQDMLSHDFWNGGKVAVIGGECGIIDPFPSQDSP